MFSRRYTIRMGAADNKHTQTAAICLQQQQQQLALANTQQQQQQLFMIIDIGGKQLCVAYEQLYKHAPNTLLHQIAFTPHMVPQLLCFKQHYYYIERPPQEHKLLAQFCHSG